MLTEISRRSMLYQYSQFDNRYKFVTLSDWMFDVNDTEWLRSLQYLFVFLFMYTASVMLDYYCSKICPELQ